MTESSFDWASFSPESIALLSDLHLEFSEFTLPDDFQADLIILAGDIHTKGRGVAWAKSLNRPCILVFGNHDYYGSSLVNEIIKAKASCLGSNVAVLDDDELILQNLRILGSTLWTDYNLHGTSLNSARLAEGNLNDHYSEGMNDHRKIRNASFSKARSNDFLKSHQKSVRFLAKKISEPCILPTLIVTHHAPSALCLKDSDTEQSDSFDPCYASNLDYLITPDVQAWLHGHVHKAKIQRIGQCLVASNPKGYPGEITHHDSNFRLYVSELTKEKNMNRPLELKVPNISPF